MSSTDLHVPHRSLRGHFEPFKEGPRAWLVLARNAIPVVGVYWFGWTGDIVLFEIWFDGVTALGAMLAFQIKAFVRNSPKTFKLPRGVPPSALLPLLGLVWLLLLLILAIPYWFTMLFFAFKVFGHGFWNVLLGNPEAIAALLLVLASNTFEESRRGYQRMGDAEIRLEFNWEFSMHLARISAMILVTFFLKLGLVIGLALVLSYIEIYPMRVLRFLGGDSTLEAGNENRSRD